jgi:hypothetical protein
MYVTEETMASKLTLRLDEELIRQAKERSRRTGRSVSRMVADYFATLGQSSGSEVLPPVVRSLKGALRGADVDEDDFRRHLEERYL